MPAHNGLCVKADPSSPWCERTRLVSSKAEKASKPGRQLWPWLTATSTPCRCTSSPKPEAKPPKIGAHRVQRVVGFAGAPKPHGPGDPPPRCRVPASGMRGRLCQPHGGADAPLGKAHVLAASRARLPDAIRCGQHVCKLPGPRTVPWDG